MCLERNVGYELSHLFQPLPWALMKEPKQIKRKLRVVKRFWFLKWKQGCGSGLIHSGSGSTKFLNPDPMRIRIHKGKFEDKFFFSKF
jgi:hypothetical protein